MVGAREVGWCGVARIRPKASRLGPVRRLSRYQRTGWSMGPVQRARSPRIRRPGRWAIAGHPNCQATHAPRDAARDAPALWCHKPKTPIGRRGASLITIADDPLRGSDLAGPASLPARAALPINPRRKRRRGLPYVLQLHRLSLTPFKNSACPSALVAACLYSLTRESWTFLAKLRSLGSRAISALAMAGSRRPRPSSTG